MKPLKKGYITYGTLKCTVNCVQGDNNGLQTVVAALELVYTDPAWPRTAPALNTSLRCSVEAGCHSVVLLQSCRESGVSRADLWQFAGTVALEIEIERANFGCDYDYNMGNQVCTLLLHADTDVLQLLRRYAATHNSYIIYALSLGQASGG